MMSLLVTRKPSAEREVRPGVHYTIIRSATPAGGQQIC